MEIQNNKLLLATAVIVVFSAMCLEGLLGTNLYLNAERRGETNTFDVSASFTAVDSEGTAMAGAAVYCSGWETGTVGGGQIGTTDTQGSFSTTFSVPLVSGDCPKKTITGSCYAQKGDTKTETVSDTVELGCWGATSEPSYTSTKPPTVSPTSTTTATSGPTSTPTAACDLGCKAGGFAGGACSSVGAVSPRCCDNVESAYKDQVACTSKQVVSFVSRSYKCEGSSCFCYTLQTCDEECKLGKCIVPTACQAKGATGDAACATIGRSCVSSTCSGGCDAASTVEGSCGCTATCSTTPLLKEGEVCQKKGQSGSEACAAAGKSCVSSTCGTGTCPNLPAAAGPCGCIATCK